MKRTDLSLAVFVALVASFGIASTCRAADLSPRAAAISYVQAQSLPVCDSPRVGPSAGLVSASAVGFLGGQLMIAGVLGSRGAGSGLGSGGSDPLSAGQKGTIAAGAILSAASIAGLVIGGIRVHRARAAKRSPCRFVGDGI